MRSRSCLDKSLIGTRMRFKSRMFNPLTVAPVTLAAT